jgi:hypothetical protein
MVEGETSMKEALRLALEALKTIDDAMPFPVAKLAIKECTAALEAKDEPVAWRIRCTDPMRDWVLMYRYPKTEEQFSNEEIQPLYTAPPQRTWVGLTDEEIRLQWSEFWEAECHPWAIDFAQAIEAKLRSKNESKN